MAENIVLLDTSILIEYFRKADKSKSRFIYLIDEGFKCSISCITEYEIYSGAPSIQYGFWRNFLIETEVLPFTRTTAHFAVQINKKLKAKSKQIAVADLFIAATAVENQ